MPFTDSDLVIEDRAGKPIRRIFADDGEPAFRHLEHEVIADLLDRPGPRARPGRRGRRARGDPPLLAAGAVVYLRVSFAEAMNRVGGDQGRPMLARPDIGRLYAERDRRSTRRGQLTVDTDARPPEEIARVLDRPGPPGGRRAR